MGFPVGFSARATAVLKSLFGSPARRVDFGEDRLRDINLLVPSLGLRLIRENQAEQAPGSEIPLVHLSEEVVCPLVPLHFDRGHSCEVDGGGDDHGGGGGHKPHYYGGNVDDVKNGRGFGGLVQGFEEVEKGRLVNSAGSEDGSVGPHEAPALGVWTALGDDYCGGEAAGCVVGGERMLL